MALGDFLRDLADGAVVWPAAFDAGVLAMFATIAIGWTAWMWRRDPPL